MSCSTCNTNNCDNNCGCIPQGLTTPNYCPNDTPTCPEPSPCNETFDADCVIYTGAPIEGLDGDVIPTNSPLSAGLNDIMDYINKRYCDLEAEFTSYPDQRYTAYRVCVPELNNHTSYCCTELPSPFSELVPPNVNPCTTPLPSQERWFQYAKPLTGSVEVAITGGEAPYTYEWTIAEGAEAGHYFRGCFPTNTNKIYLDVNFVKTVTLGSIGSDKIKGPYVTKTTVKEDGSTIAGTTLQLKVTDANGANKTFYYRYTNEDCYPVNASVCNTYNVEFCNQGQTFSNWVTIDLDFMDDERRIPTCTDLNSYGIYRPELNEVDNEDVLRNQRNAFQERQKAVFLAYSAGSQFQPFDKPSPGFLPADNLNLNLLTFPFGIYGNNNGKAPLKYINVFDGGYPISQVYDEVAGVLTNLWSEVVDPDYGTTLAVRFPSIVDLKRVPTVKTVADLPTGTEPITLVEGSIIHVWDTADDYIWDGSTWIIMSNHLQDILSVRRTRRDAQLQSSNEMALSMKPFTWANVYLLQHLVKTYRDYQITNI